MKMGPSHRPPAVPPTRLLTVAEAAKILNVSLRTVRRLISDGRLAVVRIGRLVRVRPETWLT